MKYTIQFDGSCWPNPGGTAAYGYIIYQNGMLFASNHKVLGDGPGMSNNVAEFAGCYEALAHVAWRLKSRDTVNVYGDSMLVKNIMTGKWQAKPDKLYYPNYRLCDRLSDNLLSKGVRLHFHWIPREENQECDDLSKAHLKPVVSQDLLEEADLLLLLLLTSKPVV